MQKVLSVNLLITALIFLISLSGTNCFASNLSVSNVTIGSRNPSAKTLTAQFDLSWDNSWKTKINHDAVWVTVRLHASGSTPTSKVLCPLTTSGINPIGLSVGTSANIEAYVPNDKLGVFFRLSDYGIQPAVESQSVQLEIDFDACGFDADDSVYLSVFALEMVYVPQGAFHVGDYSNSVASLSQGSGDTDPWNITSSSALSISNPTLDGFRYSSAGLTGEDASGSAFSISASFPKGFDAFYVMKYEITEGQWVEFLNSLPTAAARSNHDLTDGAHKNSDAVRSRNTVSCSGSPLSCSTQRPYRAVGYLSWMNLAAFLDWAALRPMTELEFEKASRGPVMSTEGEYVWGSTDITQANDLSVGDEAGNESVITVGANAHYGNASLSGGDSIYGAEYAMGALRSGIFAGESSDRISAGGSYYGVMELSGNVWERIVTIGNDDGRNFMGTHGDGLLSTETGFAGYANQLDWPGIDSVTSRGVTGAAGSGLRGGSYATGASTLGISDRSKAADGNISATADAGGRGVRSDDAN